MMDFTQVMNDKGHLIQVIILLVLLFGFCIPMLYKTIKEMIPEIREILSAKEHEGTEAAVTSVNELNVYTPDAQVINLKEYQNVKGGFWA